MQPTEITENFQARYLWELANVGFGIFDRRMAELIVALFERIPEHVQTLPGPKYANFKKLGRVLRNPELAPLGLIGVRALDVYSASNSRMRELLNGRAGRAGIGYPAFCLLAALPEYLLSSEVIADADRPDQNDICTRIFLHTQTIATFARAEHAMLASKSISRFCEALVALALQKRAYSIPITDFKYLNTSTIRLLRTIAEHREHGAAQNNCVGWPSTLEAVAAGEFVCFEATWARSVYTVSLDPRSLAVLDIRSNNNKIPRPSIIDQLASEVHHRTAAGFSGAC